MLKRIITLAAVATMLVPTAPAGAAVTVVVAGPGSLATETYATPVAFAPVGGPLQFLNQDVQNHSIASDVAGPDTQPWCKFFDGDCPLFWTRSTGAGGGTSTVGGLENTEAGEVYGFHCDLHPVMRGTLVVI